MRNIIIIFCLAFIINSIQAQSVSASQREVLINLYNSTAGQNWTNTLSNESPWLINDETSLVSDWYGITTENDQVVSIDLHGNNLLGVITEDLGNLISLRTLNLSNNNLDSTLPDFFANLLEIENLDLSKNKLKGILPESLANLPQNGLLSNLNISSNNFNFDDLLPAYNRLRVLNSFNYSNQAKIGFVTDKTFNYRGNIELVDDILTSDSNQYNWFKVNQNEANNDIVLGSEKELIIPNAEAPQNNGNYYFKVTNSIISGLELESEFFNVTILPCEIPDSEKEVLLDLFQRTNGQNWTNTSAGLSTWSNETSPCNWYGVTVEDGHVTALELVDNMLSGRLPKSLNRLSQLKNLNLSNNNISGEIPNELSGLINLTDLILSDNQITGAIPKAIGSLSSLKKISVANNQLSRQIPGEICTLTNLEEIDFSNNNLEGGFIPEFQLLNKLEKINISNNNLGGAVPRNLSRNLTLLDISNNSFTSLPNDLVNLNLETLNIENNNFVFSDLEQIQDQLLEIDNYEFSPQSNINLGNNQTIVLTEGQPLELNAGDISDDNSIYKWFKDGELIVGATDKDYVVEEPSNIVVGDYYLEITNVLVEGLVLRSNIIRVETADTCGVSAEEKQALLDLYNSTDGDNWTNTLANDKPWRADIPVCDWFGVNMFQGKLYRLTLQDNNLSGVIPKSIDQLKALVVLNLASNKLRGNIPAEFWDLTELTSFSLARNELSGGISESIEKLTKLDRFDLGDNTLSGSIPSSIGKLTLLRTIELDDNNLSGVIPESISMLESLQKLLLGSNQLEGEIPSEIGKLVNLTTLNLSNNNLEGNIPEEIDKLKNLRSLVLQNNNLSGAIPPSFVELNNLRNILLQRNMLSGEVPFNINNTNNISINYNNFVFDDFESKYITYRDNLSNFDYNPQNKVGQEETLFVIEGDSITLSSSTLTSPNNSYQWYKNGVAITGATTKNYLIESATDADVGTYYFEATNNIVEDLILTRNTITLELQSSTGDCNVSAVQRQALIDLYNATDGTHWTNTINENEIWDITNPNSRVCDWYGVTVDDSFNVTELLLNANNLRGQLPETINQLTELEKIDFSYNSISGLIPNNLGNLSELRSLNLKANNLVSSLPETIGGLREIEFFEVSENSLSGTIPVSIGEFVNVKEFRAANNKLSGSIPSSIGALREVSVINIAYNNLSNSLPESLYTLSKLDTLNLSSNRLTGTISQSVGSLENLKNLWLSNNSISGVSKELGDIIGLNSVRLDYNRIGGDFPHLFTTTDKSQSELRINNNRLIFSDFEDEFVEYKTDLPVFEYLKQDPVDNFERVELEIGDNYLLTSEQLISPNNQYQWQKFNTTTSQWENIQPQSPNKLYNLQITQDSDFGTYRFVSTNTIVDVLELVRRTIVITEKPDDCDNDGIADDVDTDDDNDGFSDISEIRLGTDICNPDSFPDDCDNDGIVNDEDEDDDNDGILDTVELENGTDICDSNSIPVFDCDGDGIEDSVDLDDDNDGVTDEIELINGTDICDANSRPNSDCNGDGIDDDPQSDSDNDGISNAFEIQLGTDPCNSESTPADDDTDGIPSPIDNDDDNDNVPDLVEIIFSSDPTDNNSIPPFPNGDNTCRAFPFYTLADIPIPNGGSSVRWFEFNLNSGEGSNIVVPENLSVEESNNPLIIGDLIDFTNDATLDLFTLPLNRTVYPLEKYWAEVDGDTSNLIEVNLPNEASNLPIVPIHVETQSIDPNEIEPRPSYQQFFVSTYNPTVASLNTSSVGVNWYATPYSNTPLNTATPLIDGNIYYAAIGSDNCRRAVPVSVGIPVVGVQSQQQFCNNVSYTISDIAVNTNFSGLTVKWYSSPTGGSELDTNTELVGGVSYYAEYSDGINTSPIRSRIIIEIVNTPEFPQSTYSETITLTEKGQKATLAMIPLDGSYIKWYNANGQLLQPFDEVIDGETYYASQRVSQNSICESTQRAAVTITVEGPDKDRFILCEKFRPNPGDNYVFSGWVREQAVKKVNPINKEFFRTPEARQGFIDLLNFLVDKTINNRSRVTDKFLPKIYVPRPEENPRKFDILKKFINGSKGDALTIYNFKYNYQYRTNGAKLVKGFQFSFNPIRTFDFKFEIFQVDLVINNVNFSDLPAPIFTENVKLNFINFDSSLYNSTNSTSSPFRLKVRYNYEYKDYNGEVILQGNNKLNEIGVRQISLFKEFFDYELDPDYQVDDYKKGLIEIVYRNTAGQILPNEGRINFKAKGAIIDGWQRISASFRIPGDAYTMEIKLRNTSSEGVNAYFDDIRVHPFNSNLKSFVYDPITQRLQAELDENNYATFYEYDKEGGLIRVKKETERGIYTIQETRSGNYKK